MWYYSGNLGIPVLLVNTVSAPRLSIWIARCSNLDSNREKIMCFMLSHYFALSFQTNVKESILNNSNLADFSNEWINNIRVIHAVWNKQPCSLFFPREKIKVTHIAPYLWYCTVFLNIPESRQTRNLSFKSLSIGCFSSLSLSSLFMQFMISTAEGVSTVDVEWVLLYSLFRQKLIVGNDLHLSELKWMLPICLAHPSLLAQLLRTFKLSSIYDSGDGTGRRQQGLNRQ